MEVTYDMTQFGWEDSFDNLLMTLYDPWYPASDRVIVWPFLAGIISLYQADDTDIVHIPPPRQ